jgi:hypothetical protein
VWPIAAAVAAVGLGGILAAPGWLHRRRQREAARREAAQRIDGAELTPDVIG